MRFRDRAVLTGVFDDGDVISFTDMRFAYHRGKLLPHERLHDINLVISLLTLAIDEQSECDDARDWEAEVFYEGYVHS